MENGQTPAEELISAYFDDELSGPEKARFEDAIRCDAQLRKTIDDFRVLRQSLQSLPEESLSENFSDRIIRLVEKREPFSARSDQAVNAVSSKSSRPLWSKAMVGGLLATAATICLATVLWPRNESREIAQSGVANDRVGRLTRAEAEGTDAKFHENEVPLHMARPDARQPGSALVKSVTESRESNVDADRKHFGVFQGQSSEVNPKKQRSFATSDQEEADAVSGAVSPGAPAGTDSLVLVVRLQLQSRTQKPLGLDDVLTANHIHFRQRLDPAKEFVIKGNRIEASNVSRKPDGANHGPYAVQGNASARQLQNALATFRELQPFWCTLELKSSQDLPAADRAKQRGNTIREKPRSSRHLSADQAGQKVAAIESSALKPKIEPGVESLIASDDESRRKAVESLAATALRADSFGDAFLNASKSVLPDQSIDALYDFLIVVEDDVPVQSD